MKEVIQLGAQGDYAAQWAKLVRLYMNRRGSDAGRNNKAIPRTTNGDVAQLTRWWHGEYLREMRTNPRALDRSKSSRKEWTDSKAKVDDDIKGADANALYPDNEWFWDSATRRLSLYLNSRKVLPSPMELIVESVEEAVDERIDDVKDVAKDLVDVGDGLWSGIKVVGLILGGLVGVIVVPPLIRAITDTEER